MKTLLALEELIRSYNGITALDNFKAMDCLRVLKELDLKYNGFGEDKEISSKRLLEDYLERYEDNTVITQKKYYSFAPIGYSLLNQGENCMIELEDENVHIFISDKQICLLYEMISDVFEYGEISSTYPWCCKDSGVEVKVHSMSNSIDCIVSFSYDENLSDVLNDKCNSELRLDSSCELVVNFDTSALSKVLRRILLNFRSQEISKFSLPGSKKLVYSEVLKKTLSSPRYFNVFSVLFK